MSTTTDTTTAAARPVAITVTPMRRATPDGDRWTPGRREEAELFAVELVLGTGEDAEMVVGCRDERSAALAARVAAATLRAFGEIRPLPAVAPFDADTDAILDANPTPEVEEPPRGQDIAARAGEKASGGEAGV